MTKIKYKSFDEWWEEAGRYQLSPFPEATTKDIFQKVWTLGWISAENTADGHSAEASKDCKDAGFYGASSLIKTKSIPQGRVVIEENIQKVAKEAGLI